MFVAASYRKEYFSFGATTVSVFWEKRSNGNTSYVFSGDLNGDGGTSNDLIYIHRDTSEMNFQQHTLGTGSSARVVTAQEQADLWNNFIEQDAYLQPASRRICPARSRVSAARDPDGSELVAGHLPQLGGARHGFAFRVDVLNFGNLLNDNWGVGQRLVSNSPLVVPSTAQGGAVDAQGRTQYRLRNFNNVLMTTPLEQTAFESDVLPNPVQPALHVQISAG